MNEIIVSSKALHQYLKKQLQELTDDPEEEFTFYVKEDILRFENSSELLSVHMIDKTMSTKTDLTKKKLARLMAVMGSIEEQPLVLDLKISYSIAIRNIEI